MAEPFWKCTSANCGSVHHYASPHCQRCGGAVKKHVVDDAKSLRKLLDIPEPKVSKK